MREQTQSERSEEQARLIVQAWVGPDGIVTLGREHDVDFRIAYDDGRRADGEVKIDHDPSEVQLREALRNAQDTVDLYESAGGWVATLTSRARVKDLGSRLAAIVRDMNMRGLTECDCAFTCWPADIAARLDAVGVRSLRRMDGHPRDECVLFTETGGGQVPLGAEVTIGWIHRCLTDPRFQNSWTRLEQSPADERHAFLWMGSAVPPELILRTSFHPEQPPTGAPSLPPWLTHLWVGIPYSFAHGYWTWLFQPRSGWTALASFLA